MDTPWCAIHIAQGDLDQEQVCRFLEAHGIPTAIGGEALRKTHGQVLDGLGAVPIFVPPDREAEARKLLELVHSGAFELAEEGLPAMASEEDEAAAE